MMQAMDIDGDGEVSYDEFVTTMIDWTLVRPLTAYNPPKRNPTAPPKPSEREPSAMRQFCWQGNGEIIRWCHSTPYGIFWCSF
jgi:hypothetical protein